VILIEGRKKNHHPFPTFPLFTPFPLKGAYKESAK